MSFRCRNRLAVVENDRIIVFNMSPIQAADNNVKIQYKFHSQPEGYNKVRRFDQTLHQKLVIVRHKAKGLIKTSNLNTRFAC